MTENGGCAIVLGRLVRKDDGRAQRLREMGIEVVFGYMLSLRDIRLAMAGVQRAYFCYPVAQGLVEAAVMFAQVAKEQGVELIANMSHKQSRPAARSKATQNHWLSEQMAQSPPGRENLR